MQGIYELRGKIKNYDWGGSGFIAGLIGEKNAEKKPFAEYWMGTHPLGMAEIVMKSGQVKPLDELTGPFPYLLKILDVKNMLSIQVHPGKEAAAKNFARENAAGIPLSAPGRNYKDANHKPELVIALSDLWLLHGFKKREEIADILNNTPAFGELLPVLESGNINALYSHVMEMPPEEVNHLLHPVVNEAMEMYDQHKLTRSDPDYWVAKAARLFNKEQKTDRGIFSFFLMNLVHLSKGEGIFQPAGMPHTYLEGQAVEIMANSDNVLRGGLTSKHVDVKELLKHVICEPATIRVIRGEKVNAHEKKYPVPVNDFSLHVIELKAGEELSLRLQQPEILLLTEGSLILSEDDLSITMGKGRPAALVLPGKNIKLHADQGTVIYMACPGAQ